MELLTSIKKRVLHLTLNRPDKRNALTVSMCAEIIEHVTAAQTNPEIGAILISANGSVFCAGMDLDEAGPGGPELERLHEAVFTIGIRSLKPIIVSVQGAALGGGLGLVAQGDVVMASEKAVFGLPEVRIGLFPFFIYRSVEAAIGNRRTLQASLTGHLFHPGDAMQWGLVHKICPSPELMDRAKVIARELGKSSPEAVSAGLEYVKRSRGLSIDEAGKVAAELRARVMAGDDFKEGVAAFKEKREPHWPSLPKSFYEKD
jgi:enoyl-CoA hydratase/carnithine racemase